MRITLITLGLLYVVGLAVMIAALWRSPKGFEDERGFHEGRDPSVD